jgi:hypothetical protein
MAGVKHQTCDTVAAADRERAKARAIASFGA